MTVEQDFIVWAPSGGNVMSQATYLANGALANGVTNGIADPTLYNKSIRQGTVIASVIAQFIQAQTGSTVIDDGTTATILANYGSALSAFNAGHVVTAFNTRHGPVTLESSDVTGALGFTPYSASNPSGYISSINSSMVTSALGYTPYNSSNPSGYISSINSSMVTSALGYTPANRSGDTITGNWQFNSNLIIGTGSSASPIGDQVNGVGWNGTTWQQFGAGSNFQIGLGNGAGSGDFIEFFWKTGPSANTLVGSVSLAGGGSGVQYNVTSDDRAKVQLGVFQNALDIIDRVSVKRVRYKHSTTGEILPRFIAHELQEALPSVVTGSRGETRAVGNLITAAGKVTSTNVPLPAELPVGWTWVETGRADVLMQVDHSGCVPVLWAAISELRDILRQQQEDFARLRQQLSATAGLA